MNPRRAAGSARRPSVCRTISLDREGGHMYGHSAARSGAAASNEVGQSGHTDAGVPPASAVADPESPIDMRLHATLARRVCRWLEPSTLFILAIIGNPSRGFRLPLESGRMSSHSSDPHHTTQASIPSSADALMILFDDASSSRRESGLSGTFRPQNIAYAEEQASSVLAFHWRGRTPRLQATAPEEGCVVAADS